MVTRSGALGSGDPNARMFCVNCACELDRGWRACPACGTLVPERLRSSETAISQPPAEAMETQEQPTEPATASERTPRDGGHRPHGLKELPRIGGATTIWGEFRALPSFVQTALICMALPFVTRRFCSVQPLFSNCSRAVEGVSDLRQQRSAGVCSALMRSRRRFLVSDLQSDTCPRPPMRATVAALLCE